MIDRRGTALPVQYLMLTKFGWWKLQINGVAPTAIQYVAE